MLSAKPSFSHIRCDVRAPDAYRAGVQAKFAASSMLPDPL